MRNFEFFPRDSKKMRRIIKQQRKVDLQERQKDQIEWSVSLFAEDMKKRLMENIDKPGWEDETYNYFLVRLQEELGELDECIYETGSKEDIIKEAVDVANFAMMIADKAREED